MKRDDAITEMVRMHELASSEARAFTEQEQTKFDQLRETATMDEDTTIIDRPAGPLRAVAGAGAIRSLTDGFLAGDTIDQFKRYGRVRVDMPLNIRAVGSTQAASPDDGGLTVQPDNLGIGSGYIPVYGRLMDAMGKLPVGSNALVYTRITLGTNSAAAVQELAQKQASVLDSTQVTQSITTWAHYIKASRQVLDDLSGLRALLDFIMVEGLKDVIDAGIFSAMTTSMRYTTYTPTSGDNIGDGIARIATALAIKGAKGIKVAVNPADVLSMDLSKALDSGVYLGRPRIPASVVPSSSVTQGKLLAWSDAGAVWADRQGISVEAGLDADDWTSNRITLLCEGRGDVLTLNPAFVLYGDAVSFESP